MSDAADDILTKPLGVGDKAPRGRFSPSPGALVGAASLVGLILLAAGIALTGDPRGGEPRADATIEIREPAAPVPKAAEAAPSAATGPVQSAQALEQASGVSVVRPDGSTAPDAPVIIRVPNATQVKLNPAPDPRLIERGRHGPLPRLGEGRLRPLDVYARPEEPGPGARIAILVSGLGIGEATTLGAIARLPAPISLAFSPYGGDLEKIAARAREAGHEVLLQLPMEPFDYPDSDPGPQTLLAAARPGENLDRAAWAMSRFPGFVGVVNVMGAKLMSEASALDPVLKDLAARGLGFVDDGTVPRSQLAGAAAKAKLPSARAEAVIDAVARPDAIDAELARLETLARQKGFVLASGSASPMTIDRLSRWSRDLETRGVRLVPVSVALRQAGGAGKVSSAAP
ncbi:MAG TPA: divergent polysaccharide deacetylase family protein [Methylorubrum populi]|uniref:Divergent polysaccharide deacetylase family protein n=1 Tax=Methylorubrum populi TaxID=223967 RepID=A0A921JGG0_9HYPH|nr:divergent polysaccharide deacetylase family protein [Methylorubrum populi]